MQKTSIEEHLNRGLTDACVYILWSSGIRLYKLFDKKLKKTKSIENKIVKYMHTLRNKIIELRIKGSEIKRTATEEVETTILLIEEIKTFLTENNLWKIFVDSIDKHFQHKEIISQTQK